MPRALAALGCRPACNAQLGLLTRRCCPGVPHPCSPPALQIDVVGVDGELKDVALRALNARPNFAYSLKEVGGRPLTARPAACARRLRSSSARPCVARRCWGPGAPAAAAALAHGRHGLPRVDGSVCSPGGGQLAPACACQAVIRASSLPCPQMLPWPDAAGRPLPALSQSYSSQLTLRACPCPLALPCLPRAPPSLPTLSPARPSRPTADHG